MREDLAVDVVTRNRELADAGVLKLTHVTRGDTTTFLDDHLVTDADLEARRLATQARRHELEGSLILRDEEGVLVEEGVEDLTFIHAKRTQDDRYRQLAATIDTREDAVLGIEFEIEP